MTASDIGDVCARGELVHDTVQRGNPVADHVCGIGRAEEPLTTDVHVGVVLTPAHPVPCSCHVDDLSGIPQCPVDELEESAHEGGAGLVKQRHGVFRR